MKAKEMLCPCCHKTIKYGRHERASYTCPHCNRQYLIANVIANGGKLKKRK